MAIRIVDAKIKTNYTWENIKNTADWSAVAHTNENWNQLFQTTTVGNTVTIEVEVSEGNWDSIKNNHLTWQQIKDKFATWLGVKNY